MPAKKRIVYPIQLDPELEEKLAYASARLKLPKAEVMRLAMAIGLEHLRRIDFDMVGKLCQTPEPAQPMLKVAEEPGNESSLSTPAPGVRAVKYPQARRRNS